MLMDDEKVAIAGCSFEAVWALEEINFATIASNDVGQVIVSFI